MRKIALVGALATSICGIWMGVALADLPAGSVVLTKTTPDALLLWDASSVVSKLVSDKAGDKKALATLEADAVLIAADRASSLKSAKTVTVQVIYAKTGAVSPVYATATFTGIEKVLTVGGAPSDLVKNGAAYSTQLLNGDAPTALTINVSGKLPPM